MIGYLIALIVVLVWIASWHRKRITLGKRGVDSWYFIALSFVVAALAIGGGAYGIGLRSAIKVETPKSDPTPATAAPMAAGPSLSILTPRHYSSGDKERISELLFTISSKIKAPTAELDQAVNTADDGYRAWKGNYEPYIKKAEQIKKITAELQDEIFKKIVPNNPQYKTELMNLLKDETALESYQQYALDTVAALRLVASTGRNLDTERITAAASRGLRGAASDFRRWVNECEEKIEATGKALKQ